MPFPKTDPYDPNPPWCDPNSPGPDAPWCGGDGPTVGPADLSTAALVKSTQRAAFQIFGHASSSAQTVDANFWFFLIFYYGIYCAVGEQHERGSRLLHLTFHQHSSHLHHSALLTVQTQLVASRTGSKDILRHLLALELVRRLRSSRPLTRPTRRRLARPMASRLGLRRQA